jgi:subtilisin family serine protease
MRRQRTDHILRFGASCSTVLSLLLGPVAAQARPAREAGLDKVSNHLLAARDLARQRVAADLVITADPVVQWQDGKLEIDIRFRSLEPTTVEAIRALGARIEHVSYRYARIAAAVDPEDLAALAALPEVTAIHPNYGAQRNSGAVRPQADAGLRSDIARARFGVDGAGIRVGILSDSFNRHLGGSVGGSGCGRRLRGSSPQVSLDLPESIVVLDDGPQGATDEGAALGEIVHDIAPGADLLFASAYPSEAAFAENIHRILACGVEVMVDDVLFFSEPMFQDGIVAQAAQAALDSNVNFFSAAGNQGVAGIDQVYHDVDPEIDDTDDSPTGSDLHDFGGTPFARVDLPPGCGVRFIMQWDEPFSGTLGPGASTDLDLYVLDAPSIDARILQRGDDPQGCTVGGPAPSGDPLEIAYYVNRSGTTQTVYAAVEHFCGRKDVRFRIVTFEPSLIGCRNPEGYGYAAGIFGAVQIFGHPAAEGVAAVAAVFYGEIDSDGAVTPPLGVINVNPFSAGGGEVPIYFAGNGQPLPNGPALRFKPELAAPDGVNSTFFGIDSDYDQDTFRNFAGTSAAAPHAAAVAALIRQMAPDLTPAALLDALRATARDIGAPGRDPLAGDGLIDANAALEAVAASLPTATATPTASPTPTPTTAPVRPGDCDGNQLVTIDELIVGVRIALEQLSTATCPAADRNRDGRVGIDELLSAVTAALRG